MEDVQLVYFWPRMDLIPAVQARAAVKAHRAFAEGAGLHPNTLCLGEHKQNHC